MSAKRYNAPWGRKIWLITTAVSSLGVGTAILLPLTLSPENPGDRRALWLVPLVVLASVGGTALWMIRGFEIADDAVLVKRVLWVNRISLASIESAKPDGAACKGAWKTMGNDGLFAMQGRFRSKRLGKFQAYVTDPVNSVVLKVPGDTIVISPENPRLFAKELNRRLERIKEQN